MGTPGKQLDHEVLRRAIEQVLIVDLTRRHGWREGTGYHLGLPDMLPDMNAGEALVQRGILHRDGGQLRLSEAALLRILAVAVDAATADLLAADPPAATLPELEYDDEDSAYLWSSRGKPNVHYW